jgi:hypothetical protein
MFSERMTPILGVFDVVLVVSLCFLSIDIRLADSGSRVLETPPSWAYAFR